ncbi:MAG: DNA adenine methylase, partial [Campylobacter sp.]|nr:DNA adenine methylase [Campylobacter sp.]
MRYIGNKAKLVETIDDFLKNNNIEVEGKIFCDLFSGTATVADYFQDRCHIIVNDSLYFSYAISAGKVKHNDNFFKELGFCPFDFFNSQNTDQYKKGFCYNTFAPSKSGRQYFSDENAKKIDFIRDTIDKWFKNKMINDDEKLYLIGSLIESVSKVSNVAGVYSAYLKKWDPRAVKDLIDITSEHKDDDF